MASGLTERARGTAHAGHAWLGALRLWAGAVKASSEPSTLEVVQGVHAGARLDLAEPVYTIGSGGEADIILRDPGIAPVHARLCCRGNRAEIEALGGDIGFVGGETIPQGLGRRCRLPVEVSLGGARIRLMGKTQPMRFAVAGRTTLSAVGLLAVILAWPIASNAVSTKADSVPEVSPAAVATQADATPEPGTLPAPLAGASESPPVSGMERLGAAATPADAAEQLRERLAEAGLSTLEVHAAPGRVTVSGAISGKQVEAWHAVQAWFDSTHGGNVLLGSNVSVDGLKPLPRLALQAIWYGERPYIITADGARYYEGAFVSDGWTLKEIGEKRLLLTKGSATVALTYP